LSHAFTAYTGKDQGKCYSKLERTENTCYVIAGEVRWKQMHVFVEKGKERQESILGGLRQDNIMKQWLGLHNVFFGLCGAN